MNQEALIKHLQSLLCEEHNHTASVTTRDERVVLSDVCCYRLEKRLKDLIDEDLHQRYMEDLDDLFS